MDHSLARLLKAPATLLHWLGNQGTRAVAVIVIISVMVPPIGALLRPFLTATVFILLGIAFARVDIIALRNHFRRPRLVCGAIFWYSFAVPAAMGLVCTIIDLPIKAPELFVGIMLQAVTSPIMSAPAFAALVGLDATLVLVALVGCTALLPITAPLFTMIFIGPTLSITPSGLALKLLILIAGAAFCGALARSLVGVPAISRYRAEIDGINVVLLFVFAAVIMENVGSYLLSHPLAACSITALAFVIYFLLFVLTVPVFRAAGRTNAFSIGLLTSQRNIGLMLAVTGATLSELTWIYFALAQFPLYMAPHFLKPIIRRMLDGEGK